MKLSMKVGSEIYQTRPLPAWKQWGITIIEAVLFVGCALTLITLFVAVAIASGTLV